MGSSAGSSRPCPRPFVPRITPRRCDRLEMCSSVSSQADTGDAAEGRTPKA